MQEVKTSITDLERDMEVQLSLEELQRHFALENARLRYQALSQHFGAIFALNPGASGSTMTVRIIQIRILLIIIVTRLYAPSRRLAVCTPHQTVPPVHDDDTQQGWR